MDGTIIQYDISTIEPSFRMMQLSVKKNGHKSFFYPYYIPHDTDLSAEDYVLCPYFHMVHANGVMFSFQDIRTKEAAPYIQAVNSKHKDTAYGSKFSYEHVLFINDIVDRISPHKNDAKVIPTESTHSETKSPEVSVKDSPEHTQGGKHRKYGMLWIYLLIRNNVKISIHSYHNTRKQREEKFAVNEKY